MANLNAVRKQGDLLFIYLFVCFVLFVCFFREKNPGSEAKFFGGNFLGVHILRWATSFTLII